MAPLRLCILSACFIGALSAQPKLTYERLFGGRNTDIPTSVTTDLQGNVIVVGTTDSMDFPTTAGSFKPVLPSPLVARLNSFGEFQSVRLGPVQKVNTLAFSADGTIGYADAVSLSGNDVFYRTVDGGGTWQQTPAPLRYAPSMLVIDPSVPSTVYALGYGGFFKSVDAGNTWTPVIYPSQNNYAPLFLAIDPTNSNRLFLILGSMPSRVLRSIDGGNSWQQLSSGMAYYNASVIAIDPAQPNVVYSAGSFENVFRSKDGGDTWTQLLPGTSPTFISAKLTVDFSSALYAATSKGVYKSTDGGETYTLLPTPDGAPLDKFLIDPRNAAHFFLSTNYNGRFSLFESHDGGVTWGMLRLNIGYGSGIAIGGNSLFAIAQQSRQVFVTKWNSLTGTIYAATYLGPSEIDAQPKVVTDGDGFVYISGETSANDFPVTPGAFLTTFGPNISRVGFVSKLSPDLSQLVWSTLVGGGFTVPEYQSSTYVSDLQVDASGSVYVGGASCSPDFPGKTISTGLAPAVLSPYSPGCGANSGGAFVAKLNSSGTALVYSTQLNGAESVLSLALDSAGRVYVAGPVSNRIGPGFQGLVPRGPSYVARVAASGDRVENLALLNANASARSIALAPSGDVLITGASSTSLMPEYEGAFQAFPTSKPCYTGAADAYVLRTTPDLKFTAFSFIGNGCEEGESIRSDRYGNIWAGGYSGFQSLFRLPGYQAAGTGFIAQLTPNANGLLFLSKVDFSPKLNISREGTVFLASPTSRFGSLMKTFSSNSAGGTGLLTRIDP